jgi:DMSO reductase anchor subunit
VNLSTNRFNYSLILWDYVFFLVYRLDKELDGSTFLLSLQKTAIALAGVYFVFLSYVLVAYTPSWAEKLRLSPLLILAVIVPLLGAVMIWEQRDSCRLITQTHNYACSDDYSVFSLYRLRLVCKSMRNTVLMFLFLVRWLWKSFCTLDRAMYE